MPRKSKPDGNRWQSREQMADTTEHKMRRKTTWNSRRMGPFLLFGWFSRSYGAYATRDNIPNDIDVYRLIYPISVITKGYLNLPNTIQHASALIINRRWETQP